MELLLLGLVREKLGLVRQRLGMVLQRREKEKTESSQF
jgi:hypothetical protein